MLLEAVDCPIRYRLADGHEIRLTPGQPVDLPDSQARKLLVRAVGRVRIVASSSGPLLAGQWVQYESPLFGLLSGEVLAVLDDGQIEVFHPVTLRLVRIPRTWVRKVDYSGGSTDGP